MPTAVVQVSIPYFSGFPSDVITNTWHFDSLDGEPINSTRAALLFDNLKQFYEYIHSSPTISAMSAIVRPALTVMKCYDLSDPKPRTAVRESVVPLTVSQASSGVVPPEAALCLSYRTEYESGIPKASQRGRIYLGGLSDACIQPASASSAPAPKAAWISSITTAATTLCAASLTDDWGWVVWSEKLQQSFAVAGGWVDNAIDTQRRRGTPATTRSLWTD